MSRAIGVLCVVAAILIAVLPDDASSKKKDTSPETPIVITDKDTGAETGEKFFKLYARGVAKLLPTIADRVAETDDTSYDIAKDWAEAMKAAREEASNGLDARVAALFKDEGMTKEQRAEWIRDMQSAWQKLGK